MLPQSSNNMKEKPYTTVSITSNLDYYIETNVVPFSQLETMLVAKLKGTEEPVISLHCDRSVPVDEVVKVMNIAKDNNFKLILATQQN